MYSTLFNGITDAIRILQAAQQQAEEMFLAQDEPDIIVLDRPEE
jgi:hypothetical protein